MKVGGSFEEVSKIEIHFPPLTVNSVLCGRGGNQEGLVTSRESPEMIRREEQPKVLRKPRGPSDYSLSQLSWGLKDTCVSAPGYGRRGEVFEGKEIPHAKT